LLIQPVIQSKDRRVDAKIGTLHELGHLGVEVIRYALKQFRSGSRIVKWQAAISDMLKPCDVVPKFFLPFRKISRSDASGRIGGTA
jgi:hypothetical protein